MQRNHLRSTLVCALLSASVWIPAPQPSTPPADAFATAAPLASHSHPEYGWPSLQQRRAVRLGDTSASAWSHTARVAYSFVGASTSEKA